MVIRSQGHCCSIRLIVLAASVFFPAPAPAQNNPVVGLIPKAHKPITLDGKLDDWDGAFVTPVHVGHPNFANRGGEFLFLWDEDNLYVGLRCLDQKPVHVAPDDQVYNGDGVEFYLDTRRGDQLGAAQFGPGSLHMYWTPFTGTEVRPRMQLRNLPVFRNFKLKGAEVAGAKTSWGYTAEFKLPWANFPDFKPGAGELIGIDGELCSSDGSSRSDRTFVYSSPTSVATPATFGRVRLVDKIDLAKLEPFGRVLLPASLNQSANYPWLYGTVCISPTVAAAVAKLEGKVIDQDGKERKKTFGVRKTLKGSGFVLWTGAWELFDLPPGTYTVEFTALDQDNRAITRHAAKVVHGEASPSRRGQNPSPMVEHTRAHARLPEERPAGQRFALALGTLFVPEGLKREGSVPLFVHFHGGTWLPEIAARSSGAAVIVVQLGSGSARYAKPFLDRQAFDKLLREAGQKAGVRFDPVGLSAWSAGYGAIREILKVPEYYERVRWVLLLDGLHAGYVNGQPGPKESSLVADDLEVFVRFARDAAGGKKRLLVTHSEVFPGTFASTTETADFLLRQLGLQRKAVLRWGPRRTQQLSEAGAGRFRVLGFAGNSAPDHVDQLHALPEFVRGLVE